jgi:hypothetical protein
MVQLSSGSQKTFAISYQKKMGLMVKKTSAATGQGFTAKANLTWPASSMKPKEPVKLS